MRLCVRSLYWCRYSASFSHNLSRQVEVDVRENLGELVYETIIPRNVRLSEAPSFALPALIYDHKSSGSVAYQKLAAELLKRMNDKVAA